MPKPGFKAVTIRESTFFELERLRIERDCPTIAKYIEMMINQHQPKTPHTAGVSGSNPDGPTILLGKWRTLVFAPKQV